MEQRRMTIEGKGFEHLRSVAARMLKIAKQGYIVDTIFNGVPLTSENMNTVEDILKQREEFERKLVEEYKNSPQYARDIENARLKNQEEEEKRKALYEEFKTLDFSSVPEVVNWIGRISIIEHYNFENTIEVLPTLKANGYRSLAELEKASPNKGRQWTAEEYVMFEEDLNKVGNYIIGYAIQDIENSCEIRMSYFTKIYEQRIQMAKNMNKSQIECTVKLIKKHENEKDESKNRIISSAMCISIATLAIIITATDSSSLVNEFLDSLEAKMIFIGNNTLYIIYCLKKLIESVCKKSGLEHMITILQSQLDIAKSKRITEEDNIEKGR